ncbi:MAG: hypothetical protein DRN29_08405, partial [Thermoplasmata archaeon]
SEARFRGIFENATIGMYRTTPDGKILMANPFLVKLLGYKSKDELKRRDLNKDKYYEPGYEREKFIKEIEKKGYFVGEQAWKRKDGSTIFVRESAVAVRDENGKTLYYDGVVEDITELKKTHDELAKARDDWKAIFNSISDPVIVLAKNHTILDVNPTTLKALGKKKEEVIGKKCFEFFHEDEKVAEGCPMEKLLRSRHPETKSMEMDALGGIFLVTVSPVFEGKNITKVIHHAKDITQLKQLIKALEESEEKYRTFVENANDGICIIKDGLVIFANPRLLQMGGYSEEDVINQPFSKFIAEEALDEVMERYRCRMAGEKVESIYETMLKRKDGGIIFAEFNVSIIDYEGGKAELVIVRDITERKKMEEALKESEEKFRGLVENANDAIYIITPEGFTYVNPAFERLVGYSPEEVCETGFNFWNIIHPDDTSLIQEREKARKRGEKIPSRYEFRIIAKDGKVKIVEATTVNIGEKGETKVMGILRDITERKEAEEKLKRAYEEVERAFEQEREFKLRTAHYFFNPIAIAKGFLDLAMEEAEEEQKKKLKTVRNAIERVEKVVKNVTQRGEIHE